MDNVTTSRAVVILSGAAVRLEIEKIVIRALGESGVFHKYYTERLSGIVSLPSIIDSLATSEILIVDSLSISAWINQAIGAALALGKRTIILTEHSYSKNTERNRLIENIFIDRSESGWQSKLLMALYRAISDNNLEPAGEWNINYSDVNWSAINRFKLRRISTAIARHIDLRYVERAKIVNRLPDIGYVNGLYSTADKEIFWIVFYYPSSRLSLSTEKIDITHIISDFNIEDPNDREFRILVVSLTNDTTEHRRNLSTRIVSSIGRLTKIMLAGQKEMTHMMQSDSHLFEGIGLVKSSAEALNSYRYKNEIFTLKKENLELQKKIEARLDEVQKEERFDIWESIAFTSAHKLKNPLFRIEMYVQALESLLNENQEEKVKRSLKGISDAVGVSKFVLSQFELLSRGINIIKKPINIDEISDKCMELYNPDEYELKVYREYKNREIDLDIDNVMLCIEEIVSNAKRYIPKAGGIINITIRSNHEDGGAALAIEICDNGIGVPNNDKEKIFNPFFSTREHGSGIGLAGAKLTIDSHGGSIEECGEPGKGARFKIALPAPMRSRND